MGLIGTGFGCGKRAGRAAIKQLNRPLRFCWGRAAQRGLRPDLVVVVSPQGPRVAVINEAAEDIFVEAFGAQTPVERHSLAILRRLAGADVAPSDAVVVRPFQDLPAGEPGAIVRDIAVGPAMDPDQGINFPRHPCARDAGVGDKCQLAPATPRPTIASASSGPYRQSIQHDIVGHDSRRQTRQPGVFLLRLPQPFHV